MALHRVAVTGMHAITPLGHSWSAFRDALMSNKSAVRYMEDWESIDGLSTRLAALVTDFSTPIHWKRKKTRSMGRVAALAAAATEQALIDASLLDSEILTSGRVGVAYGSCTGSTDAIQDLTDMISGGDSSKVNATTYIRLMGHTTAANIAVFFGLKGRVFNTSTACTSGSQGIGYAFDSIRYGKQIAMVAGGAEELCPSEAAIFDTLYATSLKNDTPNLTPRPFDQQRDGLVIGEGACTLILEEMEHAKQRGANIYAELVGFGTNCDGDHITQPNSDSMGSVMQLSLDDAGLQAEDIQYVNGHGTGTEHGDAAESKATANLFGPDIPFSSLKGNIGHTLGACGAIESWASIEMMNQSWFSHTLNLNQPAENCAQLGYIVGTGRHLEAEYVMCNNFAFGGINTSLIFKKWNP
ncbi:MAG: beta-ketoacyl-ACP synthase [Acidiferrobacterales bacterium]|nr:beta-ketoacyl-ACP synthase [Acidiferrobacterales bacterium]